LSDEELVKVWMAALPSTTGPGDPSAFGDYVRFLILTGCRRTEASKASQTMLVDGVAGRLLVIPKRITKSGRDHNLPVTNAISAILGRRGLERDLLFPSWKTGKPMQGWAKMLRKLAKVAGVDFTLHDLRRTFRTGLSKLRVDNDVGEICINHSRRGLEAVYNRDSSGTEMRDAFTKWSEHVEKLVHDHRWKQMRDRRYLGRKQPDPAAPKPNRNAYAELRKLSVELEDQGAFD
jgi:integrase